MVFWPLISTNKHLFPLLPILGLADHTEQGIL